MGNSRIFLYGVLWKSTADGSAALLIIWFASQAFTLYQVIVVNSSCSIFFLVRKKSYLLVG